MRGKSYSPSCKLSLVFVLVKFLAYIQIVDEIIVIFFENMLNFAQSS